LAETPGKKKIYSFDENIHHQNNESKKKKRRSSKKSKIRVNGHFPASDKTSTKDEENADEDTENLEVESFKMTRKLRRRSETRDKLEKAKEQLRQGYMILKNRGSLHDVSQLIKQPSSTESGSYIDQMIPNQSFRGKKMIKQCIFQ
jgi:hypothetical protein